MACSPRDDTDFLDTVNEVLQGDRLAPFLVIIYLDYILRTSINLIKENGLKTKKRQEADNILQKLSQMIYHFLQIHLYRPDVCGIA